VALRDRRRLLREVKVVDHHHTVEEHVEKHHSEDKVSVPRQRTPHRKGFFALIFGRD
jgi:hypothetical protein